MLNRLLILIRTILYIYIISFKNAHAHSYLRALTVYAIKWPPTSLSLFASYLKLFSIHLLKCAVMEADEIRVMVRRGMTHMEISTELKGKHPGVKGLSERSVRRFCQEQGIHKPRGRELDDIMEDSVREVRGYA